MWREGGGWVVGGDFKKVREDGGLGQRAEGEVWREGDRLGVWGRKREGVWRGGWAMGEFLGN